MAQSSQKRVRVEQMRAEQEGRRKRQVRTRQLRTVLAVVVAVAVVIGVMVAVKVTGGGKKAVAESNIPTDLMQTVTGVDQAAFATVGAGGVSPPKAITGSPLTTGGKPEVLYVGADYCPYCAAERWGIVVALSRFGTWSGLQQGASSPTDVPASVPTFSFKDASYSSDYIAFRGFETSDVDGKPLQKLPADVESVFQKYDAPPYVAAQSAGAIPFVDIANKYMISGASYSPQDIASLTFPQVAQKLHDPNDKVGKEILGTANSIAAAVCKATGDKPANVCAAPAVKAIEAKLGS